MGKNKKRKRQKQALLNATTISGGNNNNENENENENEHENDDSLLEAGDGPINISDAALETTIETLLQISQGSLLHEKRFKPLRRAIHPLVVEQLQSYDHGTDYRIKVTQALLNRKWTDALAALQGCQDFHQLPKQGTIQRWVRECDSCTHNESCKLLLLNAILVVGNQESSSSSSSENNGGGGGGDSTATATATATASSNKHDPRLALAQHLLTANEELTNDLDNNDDQEAAPATQGGLSILEDWSLGRLMKDDNETNWDDLPHVSLESTIVYQEAAAERTPPNHYDLLLHTTHTNPRSMQWDTAENNIIQHEVPFLTSQKGSAFLLENVLSVDECQQLRAAATQLGFRADHPTAMDQPTGIDSCEWMVDDSILDVVNRRVQPFFLEESSTTTEQTTSFHSINPRWRFFRYGQGCVYRPHIDGSWPASRIKEDGHYESYDEDDKSGASIKSFYTFLIYLNDNFEGGQTRFYFPKNQQQGQGLAAQGITPKCGSVLVFSQGNTASLLHEGSAVTVGRKYVVRSDVLYRIHKK
jgi:hypothetical protein